jgi:hypothetical protein
MDRSPLKNWIWVQGQGGSAFQSAGILGYVVELKRGTNAEIGLKDILENASFQNRLSPSISPPKDPRMDPSPRLPPRWGAAWSIRPAKRENGRD